MKDLGQESIEKYIVIWEVAVSRQNLYCTFFCLFIAKHFYFLPFNEVPRNIETGEGFTNSEWEMCIYTVFLENHFKNLKTLTLAWHGAYAYNPNCWQPEGEEMGVKVILNYIASFQASLGYMRTCVLVVFYCWDKPLCSRQLIEGKVYLSLQRLRVHHHHGE